MCWKHEMQRQPAAAARTARPCGHVRAAHAVRVVVVAGLYFGREIFVPLALAILLSFALAPPVRWLRRLRMPRLPAVLVVVTLAFC